MNLLYLGIGLTAILGISFLAYQSYSYNYLGSNVINNGISTAPRLVNLALGKATKQYSNYEKNRGLSYEAVDGNTNGNFFQASITSTGNDRMDSVIARGTTDPWWEVDLGEVYDIEQIKIYNRTDLNSHYITNFRVEIRNDPTEKYRAFVAGLHNYEDLRINPITFINKASARYVRIQVFGSSKFLSLAEVEVMGIPKPGEVTNIPKTCLPKETEIVVFTGANYHGDCFTLDLRNYPTLESVSDDRDKFYSLLVGEDLKANVCPNVEFQGNCREVIARRSFEEPIRSVKMADYFQLKNGENGCLEVDKTNMRDFYPVKMNKCENNKNQQWFWSEWGQLRTSGNNCLDLSVEDRVIVTPCKRKSVSNDRLQRWVWTNLDEIRTATRNKTCLGINDPTDENNSFVIIKECDFGRDQRWEFIK